MTTMMGRSPQETEHIRERQQRVVAMTRQGRSTSDIADLLGITTRTVQRDRAIAGIARPQPGPLTEAEMARAVELFDDGCSIAEVARTLGRGPQTVRRRFPGRGWTQQQTYEYRTLVRQWRREMEQGL